MSNYIKYVKFLLVGWFILKFLFIWVRVGVYKLGFKHKLVVIIEDGFETLCDSVGRSPMPRVDPGVCSPGVR